MKTEGRRCWRAGIIRNAIVRLVTLHDMRCKYMFVDHQVAVKAYVHIFPSFRTQLPKSPRAVVCLVC
jgi:hypothetical protein